MPEADRPAQVKWLWTSCFGAPAGCFARLSRLFRWRLVGLGDRFQTGGRWFVAVKHPLLGDHVGRYAAPDLPPDIGSDIGHVVVAADHPGLCPAELVVAVREDLEMDAAFRRIAVDRQVGRMYVVCAAVWVMFAEVSKVGPTLHETLLLRWDRRPAAALVDAVLGEQGCPEFPLPTVVGVTVNAFERQQFELVLGGAKPLFQILHVDIVTRHSNTLFARNRRPRLGFALPGGVTETMT